jgi:putative pyrroloquinoline-quinone binding quinoprotein
MKGTFTSTTVALAIACAGASCQRSIEGTACPCVSGYQCCPAEKACYPEGVRCPGSVAGALAWTAAGVPTFDEAGNVFVDQEDSLGVHAISLLDEWTGVPRWTKVGFFRLLCSTYQVAVFVEVPRAGGNLPPPDYTGLEGVAIANGNTQWGLAPYGPGAAFPSCPASGGRVYVADAAPADGYVDFKVYATEDGALTHSVRLDGAPIDVPIQVVGVQDRLALVKWEEGGEYTVKALELPDGQPGSVKWTARLPMPTMLLFEDPDRLFAFTGTPIVDLSLVRLAPGDGSVIWRRPAPVAAWVGSRWPGVVLLQERAELVAIAEDDGAALWTFSLLEEGHDPGRLRILDSGDILISYDVSFEPGHALHKLVGVDGTVRWQLDTVGVSFDTVDPDERYLSGDTTLRQLKLDIGSYGWTYTDDETNYPRAVEGYDAERLFVRVAEKRAPECASSCSQRFIALARRDGSFLWQTDWLFPEFPPQDFGVRADNPRVYVYSSPPGSSGAGALWAFSQ